MYPGIKVISTTLLIFVAVTVLITSSVNTEEPLWNIGGGLPEGLGFHEKPLGITFL